MVVPEDEMVSAQARMAPLNESRATMAEAFNETIAGKLREMADVLEQQQADGFRVAAYRRAAATVETLTSSIEDIAHADGLSGLMALPAIGRGIALAIMEMLSTGRWSQLERLRGSLQPEQLIQTLPGVGPELAVRIHGELHIDTLEALELAAHDGRLASVPGLGHRRVAGIRAALTERLGRQRIRVLLQAKAPPVALVLTSTGSTGKRRRRAACASLHPKGSTRQARHGCPSFIRHGGIGALRRCSLTPARAHELRKTRDWVVIYAYRDTEPESQSTIVTEMRGSLSGRRVVRGREEECGLYYRAMEAGSLASIPSAGAEGVSKVPAGSCR
jgi:putative hydrolase